MKLRELPMRLKSLFGGAPALEGQLRGPFMGMGHLGNMFKLGSMEDGWQRGLNLNGCGENGTVMACILTIARVLAASYPDHVRVGEKGGRSVVKTSAAHRLLMRPNAAQNVIDWVSWTVFNLLIHGNSYYFVQRNDRFEPVKLIPLSSATRRAFLTPDNDLFYDVSAFGEFFTTLDTQQIAPSRDVLHIKLPSRSSILHGDSPIQYAYGAIGVNSTIQASAAAFVGNMNRPSGIISTEQTLTPSQMIELREKFDEVSRGMNQGKVPILGNGLKFQPMSISAEDSQLLESYKASTLDICRIFGVPIQLLGQETNGAASSVATLIGQFKAGSLLYIAELIEFALEELFKFDHDIDTIRFDLDNVARADFTTEIETLSKAIQNAVFAPNEARNRVGLDSVPFGDEPRIQAQNVRLQDAIPAQVAPSAGKDEAPSNKPEEAKEPSPEEVKFADQDYVTNKLEQLIKSAREGVTK
jgi:HK97 family phage portal protein